jgi:hypothetical protein
MLKLKGLKDMSPSNRLQTKIIKPKTDKLIDDLKNLITLIIKDSLTSTIVLSKYHKTTLAVTKLVRHGLSWPPTNDHSFG